MLRVFSWVWNSSHRFQTKMDFCNGCLAFGSLTNRRCNHQTAPCMAPAKRIFGGNRWFQRFLNLSERLDFFETMISVLEYMRKEIEMTLTYFFTEWFRFILDSAKHKLSDTSWCHALVLAVIAQQKATANGVLCPPISDLTTAQTPRSPVRNSYKSKHFVG